MKRFHLLEISGLGFDSSLVDDVTSATPVAGRFYQTKKGDTVSFVSKTAYGASNVKAGLYRINSSPANVKIRKATTGWESYKIKGLQLENRYSGWDTDFGSGKSFPLLWVPTVAGGEPNDVFPDVIAPPPPGPVPPPAPPKPKPAPPPAPPPKPKTEQPLPLDETGRRWWGTLVLGLTVLAGAGALFVLPIVRGKK